MRPLLNCWVVAMWLWLASWGRQVVWLRRSHTWRGFLPHFGYAERVSLRGARCIEYRPPKRRLWTRDDLLAFYSGTYIVTHYRVVAIRRWETKEEALADLYFPKS